MKLRLTASFAAPLVIILAGCTERLPPPAANVDSVLALRAFSMAPSNVASFSAAGDALNTDRGVSVRLGTFTPPKGNGWADYLRSTFIAQLQAAGRYDAGSPLRIEATLTENRSGEGFEDGRARLGARFIVTRDGKTVYDKVQRVETDWSSSFFGFVAYEAALRHYTAMYPMLLDKLFADPEFRTAVKDAGPVLQGH